MKRKRPEGLELTTGFQILPVFALDTNCLQIVPSKTDPSLLREDPNPRNAKKGFF